MREDLKDAPDWIVNLLTPLNSFMSSVYYALDNDLTFTENIASSVKTISFTTRSDYSSASPVSDGFDTQNVFNPLKSKPVSVQIVKITDLTNYNIITNAVTLYWEYLDGYIKIKYCTGLADSTKYELNLLIF